MTKAWILCALLACALASPAAANAAARAHVT